MLFWFIRLFLLFVLVLGSYCLSKNKLFEGYTSSNVTGPAGNIATVATGTNGNKAVVEIVFDNSILSI